MKKYYAIKNSTNAAEIGVYSQGVCEDKEQNLVTINRLAILTDLISVVSYPIDNNLVLSAKALDILRPFIREDAKINAVNFTNEKYKKSIYYIVEFPMGIDQLVDFERCKFVVKKGMDLVSEIIITDLDDYHKKGGSVFLGETEFPRGSVIKCTSLTLKHESPYSITPVLSRGNSFYIKRGMLIKPGVGEIIQSNGLTGFDLQPLEAEVGE